MSQRHPNVPVVFNRLWRNGQWSSVRRGLRHALAKNASIILLHPVDCPGVSRRTLRLLVRGLHKRLTQVDGEHVDAAVPYFSNTPGHPVALSARAARRALRSPTASLHEFLSQCRVLEVAAGDPGVLRNLNTATDLNDYQMSAVSPRSRALVRTQRR